MIMEVEKRREAAQEAMRRWELGARKAITDPAVSCYERGLVQAGHRMEEALLQWLHAVIVDSKK